MTECPPEALNPLLTGATPPTPPSQLAGSPARPPPSRPNSENQEKEDKIIKILLPRSSSKHSSSVRKASYEEEDEQDYEYGGQGKRYGGQDKAVSLGGLK